METNPIVPRERHRRADRSAEQASPAPVAPSAPSAPQMAPRPVAPVEAATVPHQPVRAAAPMPTARTPMPTGNAPRQPVQQPRALHQQRMADASWTQPTLYREPAPRQEMPKRADASRAQKADALAPRQKLPGWLTTALCLSVVLVMGLFAAYWLMQAYLTTQEEQRIAAYEAVLDNYHVTAGMDGALHVTWQDEIERYAAQYNLQPAFVMAIIRNESSFRTNAESSVGARGLMQLMPDTAQWIAGKLDDDGYTFDRMWDAETNIRYGCWYLNYLSKLFRGDAVLVSAAYHAGQSTVTQWLSDPAKSYDGVTLDLDRLSDGPTKQYVGRVTQTYGIYQTLLYPDEAFGAADDVSAGGLASAAAGR